MSERLFLGRPSSRRPDCPSDPLCFRLLGRPTNYMLFSWVEPWRLLSMPEVCGGLFAVWEPNSAYNTVDTNVGAYNTVCVRAVEEYCSHKRTRYGPGIVV